MISPVQQFYDQQPEPLKSCYLALRDIIVKQDEQISNVMKYGGPFFCYNDKMFCYLWYHKKFKLPYISFVDGDKFDEPYLLQESRAKMKIFLIDPNQDLDIETITCLIKKAIAFKKSKKN